MIYVGIDPGKTGAMGIINDIEVLGVYDYENGEAFDQLLEWKKSFVKIHATLEKVYSMPGQGVRSVFTFGENYGEWQGCLKMAEIPYQLITPTKWQKVVFDSGKNEAGTDRKAMSLAMARRLFPEMKDRLKFKKDHNRAEGLLLAYYCRWYCKDKGIVG